MAHETVCDIVIPIWNQPQLTRRCLESIARHTDPPARLILVDNASQPETSRTLAQFQPPAPFQVQRIRNEVNVGFIKAVNQGIRLGNAPWVVILNNDTVVTPGWLTEMLAVASSDPTIGLVNPTSNSLGFHPGDETLEAYAAGLQTQSGRWAELSTALGFCLLARRTLLESLGLLDESFGMGYFDDDDLSHRAKKAGFRCVRACAAYVHHEERVSFRLLPRRNEAFLKNRRLFEERWGRRLRILWALPASDSTRGPLPEEIIRHLSRQGHWITLLVPGGHLSAAILSYSQVSFLNAPAQGWRMKGALRLLLKRKKPFDLVISPDTRWSLWLRALSRLHKAVVLDSPTQQEILNQCIHLSRSRSSS